MHEIEYVISKKYARAFLGLYVNEIDDEVITKILQVRDFLKNNETFYIYLRIPSIQSDIKRESLEKVVTYFGLSKAFRKLFVTVLEQGRIEILDKILSQIVSCYREDKGIKLFKITTSHKLDKPEEQDVVDFVKHVSGGKFVAKFLVDKKLICGFRIQSKNFLWERSIEKHLRDVKRYIFKQVGLC